MNYPRCRSGNSTMHLRRIPSYPLHNTPFSLSESQHRSQRRPTLGIYYHDEIIRLREENEALRRQLGLPSRSISGVLPQHGNREQMEREGMHELPHSVEEQTLQCQSCNLYLPDEVMVWHSRRCVEFHRRS